MIFLGEISVINLCGYVHSTALTKLALKLSLNMESVSKRRGGEHWWRIKRQLGIIGYTRRKMG